MNSLLSQAPSSSRRCAPCRRHPPNFFLRLAAQVYNQQVGLPALVDDHYVRVDEARFRRIAAAYEALPRDDRQNPAVIRSYAAFASEVKQQWRYATRELGFTFEPWTHPGQPYQDSREMSDDVRNNLHLYFFTGGEDHPFLSLPDPEIGFTANEQFRSIHDVFGHAAEGYGFGPRGELNAFITHGQMFTADAQKAMTTETLGQNAWTNFGTHNYDADGQHRQLPLTERPYAPQKVALLPDEFCDWRAALDSSQDSVLCH